MPLRDHFRSPVNDRHTWDELHGGWPMMMVQHLYPIRPAGYTAAPGVHLGRAFEIDDPAQEIDQPVENGTTSVLESGDVATAISPESTLTLDAELDDHD